MHVTTFASFKGGSGKSTTAIAMASTLIDAGRKSVFLLDLDERQTSVFRWLEDTRKIYGGDAPSKAVLHGARSTPGLSTGEAITEIYTILKEASTAFDYCIIDTKGTQTPLAIAAIQISDLVLIPFQITGIEIEPFITTYMRAKDSAKVKGAKILGITTRMPNIASTTMKRTRDVLQKYDIEMINGTTQRDGYQQLVFETGTFSMIADKFTDAARAAPNSAAKRQAMKEVAKVEAASLETAQILQRIGFSKPTKAERAQREGAA